MCLVTGCPDGVSSPRSRKRSAGSSSTPCYRHRSTRDACCLSDTGEQGVSAQYPSIPKLRISLCNTEEDSQQASAAVVVPSSTATSGDSRTASQRKKEKKSKRPNKQWVFCCKLANSVLNVWE